MIGGRCPSRFPPGILSLLLGAGYTTQEPLERQILAAIAEVQFTIEVSSHFDLAHSWRLSTLGLKLVEAILKTDHPVCSQRSLFLNGQDSSQSVALGTAVEVRSLALEHEHLHHLLNF